MTLPFKLRLLHSFTDALKEIVPANGYTSNLADFDPGDGNTMSRVYRGRAWFGDSDPIPMVSVLESVAPAEEIIASPVDDGTGEADWYLLIQGFLNDDAQNPTDPAYWLLRDIRRRLNVEKRRKSAIGVTGGSSSDPFGTSAWGMAGCRAVALRFGSGVVRPADDISAKAYLWLPVTLRIVENPDTA